VLGSIELVTIQLYDQAQHELNGILFFNYTFTLLEFSIGTQDLERAIFCYIIPRTLQKFTGLTYCLYFMVEEEARLLLVAACLLYCSAPKLEAVCISKTSVKFRLSTHTALFTIRLETCIRNSLYKSVLKNLAIFKHKFHTYEMK
jgi:hypothetical protein